MAANTKMRGYGPATHEPSMSDEAVAAKTGKKWGEWFRILDKAGAEKMIHKDIASLLYDEHGVGGWWSQMVSVEYERARGKRAVNEKADGFSVNVTRTLPTDVKTLYAAVADPVMRRKWFPGGKFDVSSETRNKYVHGTWSGGPSNLSARLDFGFYDKGKGRAQITLQANRLPDAGSVETARAAWKTAMEKLAALLDK